jgi:hypothetical protein
MSGFRIVDWRPLRKNSLLGFATVELPSGMTISDVVVLTGANGPWASPPAKPLIDRTGAVVKGPNGKVSYVPIISFASKERRNAFSDHVIAALRASHPEALQGDRAA